MALHGRSLCQAFTYLIRLLAMKKDDRAYLPFANYSTFGFRSSCERVTVHVLFGKEVGPYRRSPPPFSALEISSAVLMLS